MIEPRGQRAGRLRFTIIAAAGIGLLATITGCRRSGEAAAEKSAASLRVGVPLVSASVSNTNAGLRQLAQLLTVESLARVAEDGRFEPELADEWTLANDGRSLIVKLKGGVTFHDGSPLNAQTIADLLPDALRATILGPVFDDIDHIRVIDSNSIELGFRRPSPFLLESLDVRIRKPGPAIVATGPFMVVPDSTTVLRANPNYYLGRPHIEEVDIQPFPTVRTAWAELLRDRIDMLYEVGADALESLQASTTVGVFKFTRHYQYVMALNTESPNLQSRDIRRSLNTAIDRELVTKRALTGHGIPSAGPIWPHYWALQGGTPTLRFDPQQAAETLKGNRVRFSCLFPAEQVFERIALELKRQFAAVDVEMDVGAVSPDELFETEKSRAYDAVLTSAVSGPTLLRPYQLWHSGGMGNPGTFGNATVEAALDRVRYAKDETDYRQAVSGLQQAFEDDPPAIFLAWDERVRAVSKRFVVDAEPNQDILSNIRLWRPANGERHASRN